MRHTIYNCQDSHEKKKKNQSFAQLLYIGGQEQIFILKTNEIIAASDRITVRYATNHDACRKTWLQPLSLNQLRSRIALSIVSLL